jgi:hypothetical protein
MDQWLWLAILVIGVYIGWLWLKRGGGEGFQAAATATPAVVALPTTIKCAAQTFGAVRQYLCESEEDAEQIIKGPTDKTRTYLGPADQVCVTDDPDSGIYTCKDLTQSPDDPEDFRFKLQEDYETTCDNIVKNYLDISSNLVALNAMKDTISSSTTGLDTTRSNLNTLYMNMKCVGMTATGRPKTICDAIKAGLDEIGSQGRITQGVLEQVTGPLQRMVDSRTSLKGSVDSFRCDLG